jgi:F420-non-reducing hydrogenase iron-sulfur subunit
MINKTTIVILACQQAVPDPEVFLGPLRQAGFSPRVIAEPCSSKVETFQMLRLLADEADLLWVAGCPETACRLVEGSGRMVKRALHAQDYLKEIGLEPERLGWSRAPAATAQDAASIVTEIQERAGKLGRNPARPARR